MYRGVRKGVFGGNDHLRCMLVLVLIELLCSPANVEAAQLYKENIKEYERKVKVSAHRPPLASHLS